MIYERNEHSVMIQEAKALEIRENVSRIRENMKDYPNVSIMAVI